MFKKLLKGIGKFLLAIIILIAIFATYALYKQSEYSETAVPYVNELIPRISTWDTRLIRAEFVGGFSEQFDEAEFEKIIRFFSKLGSLKSHDEPVFQGVSSSATLDEGANSFVTYTIEAQYENGDATIKLVLVDHGDDFEIYNLNITSLALAE